MNEEQGRLDDGELVNDRFEILYLLGLGELGEVYETTDRHTAKDGVLKLFVPQVLDQPAAWQSYQDYCTQVRAYGHALLVTPSEFAIHPSTASPFAVGDKVPVPALDQLIATVGNLLPAHFARILKTLAPVLDSLHATGLVHRNLKPSNIFCALQDPTSTRLTDFEISRLRSQVPPYPGWGATPGWIAPEAIDPLALPAPGMDIYALGLVGFFAMTGRLPYLRLDPFEPNNFSQELQQEIGSLSERAQTLGVRLDPKLDPWFSRCLATNPTARFGSVVEMADKLLELTQVAPPLITEGRIVTATAPAVPSMPPSVQAPPLSTDPGVAAASVQPLVFNADLASRPAPPLAAATAAVQASPASAPTDPRARSKPRTSGSRSGLLAGLALGFTASAAIGAAWFLTAKPERKPASAPSAASAAPPKTAAVQASAAPQATESVATEASAAPVASTGQVEFRCKPKECTKVECGGRPHEASVPLELKPGQHVCLVSSEGYEEKVAIVTVEAGKGLRRDVELIEAKPIGASGTTGETEAPSNTTQTASTKKSTSTKKATTKKTSTAKKRPPTRGKPKTKPCGTFIPCK